MAYKTADYKTFNDIYENMLVELEVEKKLHIRNLARNIMLYLAIGILFSEALIIVIVSAFSDVDIDNYELIIALCNFFCLLIIWIIMTWIPKKSLGVTDKIISAVNPNIRLDKEVGASICNELYAGFNDDFNRIELKNYMEYEIEKDTKVKMADINLKYHIGRKFGAIGVFKGTIVKMNRNKHIQNEIFIESNRLYKAPNKIKAFFTTWPSFSNKLFDKKDRIKSTDEFEKYFNLYASDKGDAEIRVSEYVKDEILRLYKKYGIVFEISISRHEIYIRFFREKFFDDTILSKNKLYVQYSIFKGILDIISKINNIL